MNTFRLMGCIGARGRTIFKWSVDQRVRLHVVLINPRTNHVLADRSAQRARRSLAALPCGLLLSCSEDFPPTA
jgi:hypothetical protein